MVNTKKLILAALASVALSCSSEAPEEVREAVVRPVKFLVLEAAGSGRTRRYPAVVRAAESSELTFQVPGLLQELPVIEAQEVAKGALLARLDPRDFRSQLTSAQAEYDNAEAEYQRARRLAEGDAIATSTLEQRQSRRDAAEAQLDAAQKALGDTEMRAPFAGIVAKVHVEKFQNVQPQQEVVTLIGTGGLEVAINVPSTVVAASRTAGPSSAFVILDAAPSTRVPAQFKEAALEADSASQTYEVRFSFEPPEDLVILPGMSATLITESSATEGDEASTGAGVAVPLRAVLSEGDRTYVWVIDPETMTASKRWLTLQAGVGENMVATEGVAPGETIAGAGAAYLAEGMKVRPWTD